MKEQEEERIQTSEATHTPTNPDQPKPSQTESDPVRLPDWLTLDAVEQMFAAEGLIRTRTLLARYCRQGRLTGVKDAGPNGDEWYVDPNSVPRAITELKRIRRDEPSQTESDPVRPSPTETDRVQPVINGENSEKPNNSNAGGHSDPVRPSPTETDQVRLSQTESDFDIFEHPLVKRLDREIEYLKTKNEQLVTKTQQIQQQSFEKLVELQRMVQLGQSQTLADFFFKTKQFLLGRSESDEELSDDDVSNAGKK